jgi:hypothetical protein
LIKANGKHACAITMDDKLVCFGKALEDKNNVFVNEVKNNNVLAVALGEEHICTILASDNKVRCFGNESDTEIDPANLSQINQKKYRTVFAGRFHTCLVDFDDKLTCFGFEKSLAEVNGVQGHTIKYRTDVTPGLD